MSSCCTQEPKQMIKVSVSTDYDRTPMSYYCLDLKKHSPDYDRTLMAYCTQQSNKVLNRVSFILFILFYGFEETVPSLRSGSRKRLRGKKKRKERGVFRYRQGFSPSVEILLSGRIGVRHGSKRGTLHAVVLEVVKKRAP